MATVILEPPQIKSLTVSIVSPSIYHEVMRTDAMIFVFWMLSFKLAFPLSSFTLIKRLFSFSSLLTIRVVSSVYLWQIHFDIWQNQYNIVKLKNKIKLKKNQLKGKAWYDLNLELNYQNNYQIWQVLQKLRFKIRSKESENELMVARRKDLGKG